MATQITTVIPNYSAIPSRTRPATFSLDRDTFLTEEQLRITRTNAVSNEANALANYVNQKAKDAEDALVLIQDADPASGGYSQNTIDSKNALQNKGIFAQYGLVPNDGTNEIRPQDMFMEVDVADTLRLSDKAKQYQVRFTDGVYDICQDDFALQKAPLADGSTDELLDDKVNGLTCQTSHVKSDIVVTGNELTDGYTISALSSATVLQLSGTFDRYENLEYVITDLTNGETQTEISTTTAIGTTYITVKDTSLYNVGDNISVTLKDQSYIAERDTADMYDIDAPTNGVINYDNNEVVLYNGGGVAGTVGNYYLRVGIDSSADISAIDFTTASYWRDLGTASNMSLLNPYFKPIPYVTKQVALLIEKTSVNAIQNTVKPLVNMYGEESIDTYEADIMGELGYSQVSDRVWTDGSSEYILIRQDVLGNDKGYHKLFNEMGWRQIDGSTKLGLDSTVSSMFECFDDSHTLGDVSGRPDGRNFNFRHIEGNGGGISFAIPNAKTPSYKHTEEVKRNLTDGYVEDRNNVVTQGSMTVAEEISDTSKTLWALTLGKAIEVYQVLYTIDSGVTWNTQSFTHDSVNNQITLGTARTDILVSYQVQNQSAIPVDAPKPIKYVDRDLIASNHNEISNYCGLVYASSNKVSTGAAVETKHINDIVIDSTGVITTIPGHNELALDADSIVGVKALISQTADKTQLFTQEMIYDVDWGDSNEFDQLTDGTLVDLNGNTVQTKILHKASSCKIGE